MSPVEILVVGPLLPALQESLDREYSVQKLWEIPNREGYLREQGASIRALVTTFIHGADTALIQSLPNLEIIASYGVGLERIDLDTACQRVIQVTTTPDIQEPVADTAIALLLAVTRRICEGDRYVKAGQWPQRAFPFGTELGGKTCGIVGLGRIGRAIARRAEAFGMRIAYHGPNAKSDVSYRYYDDLETLAKEADFLILALPGGAETRHLIDARILTALGPSAFLVNVARGSVVDEQALVEALQTGKIAGAGLDVFEHEPLTESPLMQLENVVLLPHIASATTETRHAMGEVVLANLKAHFTGQQLITPIFQRE
ncbi:MAG TPA: 2-hydroxyacid dehydrogenase [Coleofasciculaceae cyanobacterium]|jgi:lactate dehydrogenase-like 2-hydroxyacid dehydrogenase